MSRTERKNGNAVWAAAQAVGATRDGWAAGMFTVGEVAAQADLSRPTVRKYIDMCVEKGVMLACEFRGGIGVYKFKDAQ
ncbi:MAG: chemotaxis protein [Inoviridae sp.]|nr:MAG: chemotaxis protein [Inoviridae sp.]